MYNAIKLIPLLNKKANQRWPYFIVIFLIQMSCKKAIDVAPPSTSLVSKSVFSTNATASAAVTGIYVSMAPSNTSIGGGTIGISALLALSADEFNYYDFDPLLSQVYSNKLMSTSPPAIWNQLYNYIYQANAVLEGLENSTAISDSVRRQLTGECKFIRAFCHFYLTNIYGEIPIVTTTNYIKNNSISKSPISNVYLQIIEDLKAAQDLLNENYIDPGGAITLERSKPNKEAAKALLSRVYLYNGNWTEAENEATAVISNVKYSLESDLNAVFLKNSSEAIWQLQPVISGFNAPDAGAFNLWLGPPPGFGLTPFSLTDSLYNSFEANDARKLSWIGSLTSGDQTFYYANKYKAIFSPTVNEYTTILRLSEQYLIRAEARAQQDKFSESIDDIDKVRNRAGLPSLSFSMTQNEIMLAIEKERRVELFSEYGHRWLDLKRFKGFSNSNKSRLDEVMEVFSPNKGNTWNTYMQLFPIPLPEVQINPNLTQNPGYQ